MITNIVSIDGSWKKRNILTYQENMKHFSVGDMMDKGLIIDYDFSDGEIGYWILSVKIPFPSHELSII